MKSLSKHQKGVLFALLSGIFYGFLGYFGITIIECNCSVANMLFWRFAVTSVTMMIVILPKIKSVKDKKKDIILSLFFGALFYSASAIFYFTSSKYVGTGIAMVMYFAYPVFVILINFILYQNKITKFSLVAVCLLAASMFMLVDISGSSINFFGLILGLFAALGYAIYIVASKGVKLSANLGALTVSLGSAATCLIMALIEGSFAVPGTYDLWINIFGLSLICTTLPILFLLHALKYISSEKASLLSVTEPLFVIIISMIFLGEKITIIQAWQVQKPSATLYI
jgi:drug/metabolite transporter (DMT)-like permease